jgi:hypothetical protein
MVSREIRLHYERVVGVAVLVGVMLPLYFLLTGYAVAGANQSALQCGSTLSELGSDRPTVADPGAACHGGAVARLHLAAGYLVAGLGVALVVWVVAGARERALNRAWAAERAPSRWISTPSHVWIFAALLYVVLAPALHSTV